MAQMYLGRIVAAAVTPSGKTAALYRVSSRSFPNRTALVTHEGKCVSVVPKTGHEPDIAKNPYIAYNALRIAGDHAVLANGSHTDPIAEKLAMNMPAKDALALSLLAMDYEKDDYDTPRVATVVHADSRTVWLGTVRKDGLDVRAFDLEPGQVIHLATYEHNLPASHHISGIDADTAEDLAEFALSGGVFAGFEHPVTAVAAVSEAGQFQLAVKDVS